MKRMVSVCCCEVGSAEVTAASHTHTPPETPSASSSEDEGQGMVNVSLFTTNPEITHSFPCTELKDGVEAFPR